jgi:hypothetical protein
MKTGLRRQQQSINIDILLNALHNLCMQQEYALDSVQWPQLICCIRQDVKYSIEICESNSNYTRLRQFYMNHFKINNGQRNRVLANFLNKFMEMVRNNR